ncbi:MAG: DUF1987 domain-containing protein [Reichenbachiella sp.]|uniref:DUF1987 domain-containing protein n=1 Tax=Reichenbachiella sp. TaxID=2184521 RepID=UPI003262FE89
MQGYFIRSSRVTPSVYFNPKKELLDLRGKSSPENPLSFYGSLLLNMDRYAKSSTGNITVNLAFEYFNTSSSKCIFNLLRKLENFDQQGKRVIVNWYYEDEDDDMLEAGEDFSSFFGYEFNFVSVPVINSLGEETEEEPQLNAA